MKSIAEVQARNSQRGHGEEPLLVTIPAVAPSHWLEAAINGASTTLSSLPETGSAEYQGRLGSTRARVEGLQLVNDDSSVDAAATELEALARIAGAAHSTPLWLAARALRNAKKGPLLARG